MTEVDVIVAELTCLANEAQEQEQLKEALNLVNKAIQLKKGKVGLWKLASDVLVGLRRSQDALNALSKAISLDPDNLSLRLAMGDLLRSLGNNLQAIKVYLRASKMSPYDPQVSERLVAIARGKQGRSRWEEKSRENLLLSVQHFFQEDQVCPSCGSLLVEIDEDTNVIEHICMCNFDVKRAAETNPQWGVQIARQRRILKEES